MANPPKPWKAEYAKSGRSSCKACKDAIAKDQLRLGKMVAATQFDGFMPMWNHASCIFKKGNQIKSSDDVEGYDLLRWDDQQKIRMYVEGGLSSTAAVANNECAIEVSQTSRAACRRCNQKIMKGTVRVSTKPEGQGAKGLAWHHVNCFVEMSPSTNLEKIYGWDMQSLQDKETIFALVKKNVSGKKAGLVFPIVSPTIIADNPSYGKCRDRSFPTFKDMAFLTEKTTATGRYAGSSKMPAAQSVDSSSSSSPGSSQAP